jgi:hypothetical protein
VVGKEDQQEDSGLLQGLLLAPPVRAVLTLVMRHHPNNLMNSKQSLMVQTSGALWPTCF